MHFMPSFISMPPENIIKPEAFWYFQWGIEMEHWLKMSKSNINGTWNFGDLTKTSSTPFCLK